MTDPMHQQLLGHLLGALDDVEQERMDARLEHDEELRRQLVQWRRRLAPLEALRPEFEPPPGLAARTCRFVAACMPVPVGVLSRRQRMSPDCTPPSRAARLCWHDVAAVALLLVAAGAMVLPAIYGSRHHARLASCQDGLRQFGAALSEYGHHHGSALTQFANNGRLTPAGVFVAELLPHGLLTDRRQAVCPDAWLAAQGAPYAILPAAAQLSAHSSSRTTVARIIMLQAPGQQCWGTQSSAADNGPVTWCYDTAHDRQLSPSPVDVPLLADAPGVDLPDRALESHGGRGRNVLFEDGHVNFLPCAAPPNVAGMSLSHGSIYNSADFSAPITFVSDR